MAPLVRGIYFRLIHYFNGVTDMSPWKLCIVLTLWMSSAENFAQETNYVLPADYTGVFSEVPKYALVIGVENYEQLPKVKNAISDARGFVDALLNASQPFNGVRYLQDVERGDDIRIALEEIKKNAQPNLRPAIVVVYFAGHGFQYDDKNFIAPKFTNSSNVLGEGVAVSELIEAVASSNISVGLIIIDACRDNVNNGQLSVLQNTGNSHIHSGFSRTDGGVDSIYIFSASSNNLANSQSGHKIFQAHSPFSGPLIANIPRESLSVMGVYEEIASSMRQESMQIKQIPVWGGSLSINNLYIFPSKHELESQNNSWKKVVSSGFRSNCIEDYLSRYPIGPFSDSAIFAKQYSTGKNGDDTCSVIAESK